MRKSTRRIPLTQGKFAIVDACDYEWLMQWKWYVSKSTTGNNFYAVRHNKTIPMHQEIARRIGLSQVKGCDHKDRNGLNNCRDNIRPSSKAQNCVNRKKRIGVTSKYNGVSWDKAGSRWRARCGNIMLGSFASEYQAHLAYMNYAKIQYGEFACSK